MISLFPSRGANQGRWPSYSYGTCVAVKVPSRVIGLDLEWERESKKPTILGTASSVSTIQHGEYSSRISGPEGINPTPWAGFEACSMPFDPDVCRSLYNNPDVTLVGHNLIQGDLAVLGRRWKCKTRDTMILFYLCHAHLCKARSEKLGEQDEDKGAGGYMNLWTMASLYTDLAQWKECRDPASGPSSSICSGPCPTHNVFWYNALDALAPVLALPKLEWDTQIKKVDHLYPVLEKASHIASLMTERGISIDPAKLQTLEADFNEAKAAILQELPKGLVGPEGGISPKGVPEYFRKVYGATPQSSSEKDLEDFYEQHGCEEAGKLLELKGLGKGLTSWFDGKYVDRESLLHPSFLPASATSTGRWASKNPNFQNIPIRRTKDVRNIVVSRPGTLLYKADYKQGELRAVLYQAGAAFSSQDFKQELMSRIGLSKDDPGVKTLGGVWNATKSLVHAANYGEGLMLLEPEKLKSNYYRNLVAKGALEAHEDWIFQGKVVTFTGVNLASRMFGRSGFDERTKALETQNRYLAAYPEIRRWQQKVTKQIEADGQLRAPSGFLLELYGWPKDTIKAGLAFLGSNPIAYLTTLAILRIYDDGVLPLAQIHDEILFEFPEEMPQNRVRDRIKEYCEFESSIPVVPAEISCGRNWGEMQPC